MRLESLWGDIRFAFRIFKRSPAVALSTALRHLVMMDTFDVAAFSAGIVIVIAACLVAAFYPARRAAGVEPWVALRIE